MTASLNADAPIFTPRQPSTRDQVRIGRIWIDALTFDQALTAIADLVEMRAGGLVFTPNVDHVLNMENNASFNAAYAGASLSLADGMPVIWASKLLATPLPEKISGSDMLLPLLQRASTMGWRVYLVGGADGVAIEAAAKMRSMGVNVVGADSPLVSTAGVELDDAGLYDRMRAAKPDLVLAALGSPKQELWLKRMAEYVPSAVGVGIGASLDFLIGRVQRSPRWMSRSGLEWAYRLGQEPRRLWRRYLVHGPKFFVVVGRALFTAHSVRTRKTK